MWQMIFIVPLIAVSMIVPALQDRQRAQPGPPPAPSEVKQTVDALNGTWTGQMTAKVPGHAPATFDWLMECKTVALGSGVACANGGRASIGELSEIMSFAFDRDGKAVHYMCVTSMGEVHDHKGHWKDNRVIEFESLRAGMMGGEVI